MNMLHPQPSAPLLKQIMLVTLMLWALTSGPSSATVQPCANQIHGKVERVIDGDTFVMRTQAGDKMTLRLAGIDAPEKKMPFGNAAKAMLIKLLNQTTLAACPSKTDRYGRTIATVFSGGEDVNLALIKEGLAWHFKRYARDQPSDQVTAYADAEIKARSQVKGLWYGDSPIPPWDWRHSPTRQLVN
jgi:endonuclease YncB( thermonuclease family)